MWGHGTGWEGCIEVPKRCHTSWGRHAGRVGSWVRESAWGKTKDEVCVGGMGLEEHAEVPSSLSSLFPF